MKHFSAFYFCRRIPIFLVLYFSFYTELNAQYVPNNEYYYSKNEIGVSVTSILSNVLSFNANNVQTPYGIFYRHRFDKMFLRVGLDLSYDKSDDSSFDPATGVFFDSELETTLANLRIGLEKNIQISRKFQFFGGVDVFGHFESENNTLNFNFRSEETRYLAGLGPAIRLEYKLGKRIFISTESTLYFGYGTDKSEVFVDGSIFDSDVNTAYKLKLTLPQVLFISIQL